MVADAPPSSVEDERQRLPVRCNLHVFLNHEVVLVLGVDAVVAALEAAELGDAERARRPRVGRCRAAEVHRRVAHRDAVAAHRDLDLGFRDHAHDEIAQPVVTDANGAR